MLSVTKKEYKDYTGIFLALEIHAVEQKNMKCMNMKQQQVQLGTLKQNTPVRRQSMLMLFLSFIYIKMIIL